jgi:hypothetical protein
MLLIFTVFLVLNRRVTSCFVDKGIELMTSRFIAFIAFLLYAGAALSQTVPIQQQAQRLDAGAVVFAQAAVASASIATVTVPTGQFAYITGISIDGCQNATGSAVTNGNITSTGLSTNPAWSFSQAIAVNGCFTGGIARDFPTTPIKSLSGTNVVITSPATPGWQYTIRIYYYLNNS